MTQANHRRLPPWLKRRIGAGETFNHTHHTLDTLGLETICTNANCPNRGDCWGRGTATVLILGNICTRNCKFCSVGHGKPLAPDATEPDRVAQMVVKLHLEPQVEPSFQRDSYGYRPKKSALEAVDVARRRCWQNDWVLDLDIKGFFDNIDHSLMLRAVRNAISLLGPTTKLSNVK